jgi:glycosyltransferase involved in cell wall biosynthesis
METKTYSNLSVVMISKNEEKAISSVITEILSTLPGVEVIVVDGSSDKTAQIAQSSGASVYPEPIPGGYGPALNYAVFKSNREFVATVDADHTYNPSDIAQMMEEIKKGYDIVGGSRLSNGRPQTMPRLNYHANRMVNLVACAVFMRKIHDIHSGLRLYRMSELRNLNWNKPDYGFTVELLLVPLAKRFKVKELPISYRERIGSSQLMKFKSLIATFVSIIRSRFRSNNYNMM